MKIVYRKRGNGGLDCLAGAGELGTMSQMTVTVKCGDCFRKPFQKGCDG